MQKQRIAKVWVDDNNVFAQTTNGNTASYPFSMWKRLAEGTPQQRQDFYLTYTGIHWRQLDEDLSFEGMFSYSGKGQRTTTEDSYYWEA